MDDETPADFRTDAFDYVLPEALVAQRPADRRDASRLLVLPRKGPIRHLRFADIAEVVEPGDLLIANDAKVLRARFQPRRREGGRAEVLLLHPSAEPDCWEAMARPGRRIRKGDRLSLGSDCGIEIVDWAAGGNRIVRFYGIGVTEAMARFGDLPLPPYIHAPPPDADERYQTIYAAAEGSVAAPTAGLHFTEDTIEALRRRGIGWTTITLHVGAGTFRPVKTDDLRAHHMHAERYEIPVAAVDAKEVTRSAGKRIIAVGTTVLRALEASARADGTIESGERETSIFIHPPYRFRTADALLTNFHLPRSTLLMLVSAFAGRERVLAAYAEAIANAYRFYSFGDAMFVERAHVED
ncbi:MAG TPA: tRNA preQ1(34) S-adenosylmethionine ribosyltransferase-isomerase QueA [Candidatus Eremiobacteraceae bacterium]|nr:tRNA preQ1(34) S-adenosylmethionine ribosyltransferase-isomerase QueA [Candidatus Eremiobacteraceae bacterium]